MTTRRIGEISHRQAQGRRGASLLINNFAIARVARLQYGAPLEE